MSPDLASLRGQFVERVLPPLAILCAFLVIWQGVVRLLDIPPWLLPAPTDIVQRFFKTPNLWYHTGLTVLEALAGFIVSAMLGIALSAGIVHSRR
jgi:NitT/TauT family transport system permease protein